MRTNNRNVVAVAANLPTEDAQGYGALSYTPNGYWAGYLNHRLTQLFHSQVGARRRVPTIYSYSTPIAWYDYTHNVWVVPDVRYSVTTGKHQGYLYMLNYVSIPYDCGIEEYERYVSGRMVYTGKGTAPGPYYDGK